MFHSREMAMRLLPALFALAGCAGAVGALAAEILPPAQAAFATAVEAGRKDWDAAHNDWQRDDARERRKTALCKLIGDGHVEGWLARVIEARPEGNRAAYLAVHLDGSEDIELETINLEETDARYHTLIREGTPIFSVVRTLGKDDPVTISGDFIAHGPKDGWGADSDCLTSTNWNWTTAMHHPTVLFRFTAVAKRAP